MRIVIEDYNGNDLCSFEVPSYEKDTRWLDSMPIIIKQWNCSLADVDTDDNGNEYIRVQLDIRPLEI